MPVWLWLAEFSLIIFHTSRSSCVSLSKKERFCFPHRNYFSKTIEDDKKLGILLPARIQQFTHRHYLILDTGGIYLAHIGKFLCYLSQLLKINIKSNTKLKILYLMVEAIQPLDVLSWSTDQLHLLFLFLSQCFANNKSETLFFFIESSNRSFCLFFRFERFAIEIKLDAYTISHEIR